MYQRIWRLIGTTTVLALIASVAHASMHEVFKGKIVRIVVGFGAGSGFDIYSRVIARYIGKHIPGKPTIIVENMPGAGGLIAANHLYKVAKPDGLTISNFTGSLLLGQILGRPGIEFDALKFEYVGVPLRDSWVCVMTKASKITSMEKWMVSKTPVKLGGLGAGTAFDDVTKVLKATLGLPIHLVSGYKSAAELRQAADGGEIDGVCGWSWDAVKAIWTRAIESGDAVVVLQMVPRPHPDLPKVPLAIDFAKTEEARQLIQVGIYDMVDAYRLYLLPPGTPIERVQALQKAFMDTMKDPEFSADIQKSRLSIDPVAGEELKRTMARLFKLSPAMVAKLKEVLM